MAGFAITPQMTFILLVLSIVSSLAVVGLLLYMRHALAVALCGTDYLLSERAQKANAALRKRRRLMADVGFVRKAMNHDSREWKQLTELNRRIAWMFVGLAEPPVK